MAEQQKIEDGSIQQQIIQAAQQLFQVHGLHKVTMDDVAKEVGKGRSSLYYYYKTKEEILDAAMDAERNEIFAEIAKAVNQAGSFEEKIKAYLLTRLKISKKRLAFYETLDSSMNAGELSDFMKLKIDTHKRFRQMEIPLLRGILHFGIEKGQLRAMDEKETDTLIFILLSTMQGFKKELLIKKSFASISPAITMLTQLVLQGYKK